MRLLSLCFFLARPTSSAGAVRVDLWPGCFLHGTAAFVPVGQRSGTHTLISGKLHAQYDNDIGKIHEFTK